MMSGCSTKAGTGAGSGALIGQAVGGNTRSTVSGAAVSGMAGAIIGDSKDRK